MTNPQQLNEQNTRRIVQNVFKAAGNSKKKKKNLKFKLDYEDNDLHISFSMLHCHSHWMVMNK